MIDSNFIAGFKAVLQKKHPVVIIPHTNPDGDALGSALALLFFLKEKGVPTSIISPNEVPKFIKTLPGSKNILIAQYNSGLALQKIKEAAFIFCLDFNILSRSGSLLEMALKQCPATPKFLIDHHQNPDLDAFDYVCVDTFSPATAQILYRVLVAIDPDFVISPEIAACLYTGIMTDTGSFRYRSTTAETHRIVADLLETGVDQTILHANVYDGYGENRMKLLSKALNSINYWPSWSTACMVLSREDLLLHKTEKGDTEGFVNYALMLKDVKLAVFLKQDTEQDFIRVSLRSKAPVDVNQIARAHFNGGGHTLAAGGRLDVSIEKALLQTKQIISNYKDLLLSKAHVL